MLIVVMTLMMTSIQAATASEPSSETVNPAGPGASEHISVVLGDQSVAFSNSDGVSFAMKMPASRASSRSEEARYGSGSYELVVETNETGAATFIEIADSSAPEEYVFEFDLPKGWMLKVHDQSGAVAILNDSGEVVGGIAPPWAVDADGNDVTTAFDVRGKNKLVQTVQHEGADYPVVADPSVTFGRNVYTWWWGWEIAWWGSASAAYLSAYFCAVYGWLHPVMCAVGVAGAGALITALHQVYGGDGCRYVVAFRYWGWPNYIERLSGYGCTYAKWDIPG